MYMPNRGPPIPPPQPQGAQPHPQSQQQPHPGYYMPPQGHQHAHAVGGKNYYAVAATAVGQTGANPYGTPPPPPHAPGHYGPHPSILPPGQQHISPMGQGGKPMAHHQHQTGHG